VNRDFVAMCDMLGEPCAAHERRAERVRLLINAQFWPTPETLADSMETYRSAQLSLGKVRYLIAQITPFGFSWRCDVFANVIAYLYRVIDDHRAESVWRFLRQINADQPFPIKVLYPVIQPGDADWRDYFLVNLLNLPHHYHNGGIWPFVGGLWVRFLMRLRRKKNAAEALAKLAALNHLGIYGDWEFSEWAHGQTGEAMGKEHQAWSAASYVAAYLRFLGDTTLEDLEMD
jgi:hypothetical protein